MMGGTEPQGQLPIVRQNEQAGWPLRPRTDMAVIWVRRPVPRGQWEHGLGNGGGKAKVGDICMLETDNAAEAMVLTEDGWRRGSEMGR